MEIVVGAIALVVVYLLVEAFYRREDIRRFCLEQIETYALSAFRFAARRNSSVAEGERKTILALPPQAVIDIAQRLPSATLIRTLAEGCADDDLRADILSIAESTSRRGRRAILAKTRRTQRTGQVQE
jgi:hypothetical protein